MKTLLLAFGLVIAVNSYSQKYIVGIVKTGSEVKNIEGQIIVSDSTVTSNIDGLETIYKVTSRAGYTLHVTDGTTTGKYVISHGSGRLHGFTYDRHVTFHPDKHHPGTHIPVYYCLIQRDLNAKP